MNDSSVITIITYLWVFFHYSYKTGQIIVVKLEKGKQDVLKILKGHNDEVQSLVWSPVPVSELPGGVFKNESLTTVHI